MANVFDVAQYILEKTGEISAVKLQKLVYYVQAWSLVWRDEPLFSSKIEAWANGPVVRELFDRHKGKYKIAAGACLGNSDNVTSDEKDVIDNVLRGYAHQTTQWLVELTHLEEPWKEARCNTPAGVRCSNEISLASMHEYYSGL